MHNDEQTVEAVYIVTIRNSGDERALGAGEVEAVLNEAAGRALPDERITVSVEAT